MNLTKCSNGHFYDKDKYDKCPQCQFWDPEGSNETVVLPAGQEMTVPINIYSPGSGNSFGPSEGTVGMYSGRRSKTAESMDIPVEPVVGWLVSVKGKSFGASFPLHSGRNFIGRDRSNDVCLPGDTSISRQCHAIFVYDPKGKSFIIMPGTSRELFYLNDKVVLGVEEIKMYDRISIGHTDLIFVPLCGEEFSWEDYMEKNQKD